MTARIAEFRRFFITFAVAYTVTSLGGTVVVAAMVSNSAWLPINEIQLASTVAMWVIPFGGLLQYLILYWYTNGYRKWSHGSTAAGLLEKVQAELLSFPIAVVKTTASTWAISATLFIGILINLESIPRIRQVQILLSLVSIGALVCCLQYVAARAVSRRIFDAHYVLRAARGQSEHFAHSWVRYNGIYITLMLSSVLVSGIASYSLIRKQATNHLIDTLATLIALARDTAELYPTTRDDAWRNLEIAYDARISVVEDEPDIPALAVYFEEEQHLPWYMGGFSYTLHERQVIPYRIKAKEPWKGKYLVAEIDTTSFRSELTQLLIQTCVVYGVVLLMCGVIVIFFVLDSTRPLHRLREFFADDQREILAEPSLHFTDDESGLLGIQMVSSLRRIQGKLGRLKNIFWSIRDSKKQLRVELQEVEESLETHLRLNEKYGQQLDRTMQRLRTMEEPLGNVGSESNRAATTLLKLNETYISLDAISSDVESQVEIMNRTVGSYTDSVGNSLGMIQSAESEFRTIGASLMQIEDVNLTVQDALAQLKAAEKEENELIRARQERIQAMLLQLDEAIDLYGATLSEAAEFRKAIDKVWMSVRQLASAKDETDILAFQTTIVASQSASFQRDFLVVADEMRELAERTESAATGVRQKLSTMIQDSTVTLNEYEDLATIFEELTSSLGDAGRIDSDQAQMRDVDAKRTVNAMDGLVAVDDAIEYCLQMHRESRQHSVEIADAAVEQQAMVHELGTTIAQASAKRTTGATLIESHVRALAGLSETIPQLRDSAQKSARQNVRLMDALDQCQALSQKRVVLNKELRQQVRAVEGVFEAAEDALDISDERVRELSRFIT